MSEAQTIIEGWAIVELFGHNKIAGYVTTSIIGTSGMLRVDIPAVDDMAAYTRFYGPGAIYSLTLVEEAIAREALASIRPAAVTVYIRRQLEAPYSRPYHEVEEYLREDNDDEEDNRS